MYDDVTLVGAIKYLIVTRFWSLRVGKLIG